MTSAPDLDIVGFCALATLSETQQVSLRCYEAIPTADPEKVFAETLCLLATAGTRAAMSTVNEAGGFTPAVRDSLLGLPITLHSYVAGTRFVTGDSRERIEEDLSALERMIQFYTMQIAEGIFPAEKILRHVMVLWMGRISPRGLEDHPEARLDRLALLPRLISHTELIRAYARSLGRSE